MNILVTGAFQLNSGEREQLESAGHKVFIHGDERTLVDCPERYEAVVCNSLFLYNPIERFTSLRVIQLTSAGLDRVPLDDIRVRNIALHNAAGVYSVPMAEFAVCGILQLYKQSRFLRRIRRSTNGRSIAACWSFPASGCASSAAEMWGVRSRSGCTPLAAISPA